ncbi:beta-lactamase-like protein [Aspergillus bertholletiae]|uniref:Beta-lactamase-like protein n=1 Tax=Aspergillus bertholletiae TaxID=1226010 RepID=A0A5N7AS59_9EURO|nr:beta-lactamase-like protein [Aspergillus bertholletiae]
MTFSPSFEDRTDFDNATRGFIRALKPCIIRNADGRVVWNNDEYDFLHNTECPATAEPKLWRQGQLNSIQGLFQVTDGIYQVRGFDISNMTVVEGEKGVIVIDPLTSVECAAAALALYRGHRGDRPVTGLIYSHSHGDHFGGAQGVLQSGTSTSIPIIAPEGFMEEATSENIYVGEAMRRRARCMYGVRLPKGPDGHIGCGLGMITSSGTMSLIPPNVTISHTGEERTVDGVRIEFQMVPGTEAPAEMNFYFPERKALCIAECATHCLHNVLTLRGALVRDAKAWARYLDETAVLYGQRADVLFAGHNWPTWGRDEIVKFISEQRDLYAYLHDQTVRMMNTGLTGIEIAERFTLPPALQMAWHAQGYYGSVSHNVKAIYQRYLGWFDGNPAHLWEYPPAEAGQRYVDCMGGVDEVVRKAREYANNGDVRFAVTLLGHAIAAHPEHKESRLELASAYKKLAYGCENATWRNFYLSGAQDMYSPGRRDNPEPPKNEYRAALSVEQLFTLLSVELDGPRAVGESFMIDLHLADKKESWRLILSNGALTYRMTKSQDRSMGTSGLRLTLTKNELVQILNGRGAIPDNSAEGDVGLLFKLMKLVGASKTPASVL